MGNQGMGRHGLCRVAAIALLSGIAAACSSIPDEPAPVFMKGGMPGVAAAGPGPIVAGPRPGIGGPPPGIGGPPPSAPMPRADRQITVDLRCEFIHMAGLQHLSHPQRGTVLMLVATKVAVCEVACSIVIARPKVGFVRGSGTAARRFCRLCLRQPWRSAAAASS